MRKQRDLRFTRKDVFEDSNREQAVAIVRRIGQENPVPTRLVALEMKASMKSVHRWLEKAAQGGSVNKSKIDGHRVGWKIRG